MSEEQLRIAVFIDFDNIEIGVKQTLNREFDITPVLEALKERGEVISKIAYGNWKHHGNASRRLSEHAVQMVQRDPTPRGDKNGADINLALDALEMAFTRQHINAYAIVGGDSDFVALVEKLKQYNKAVFVVGGRQFTSGILQRNCREFISYENLVRQPEPPRQARPQARPGRRGEALPAENAMPLVERALKVLAEREHQPLLGLVKSTMLQLDSTFSEREYGCSSFLDFIQKLANLRQVRVERVDSNYAVKLPEMEQIEEAPAERHVAAPAREERQAEPPATGSPETSERVAAAEPARRSRSRRGGQRAGGARRSQAPGRQGVGGEAVAEPVAGQHSVPSTPGEEIVEAAPSADEVPAPPSGEEPQPARRTSRSRRGSGNRSRRTHRAAGAAD